MDILNCAVCGKQPTVYENPSGKLVIICHQCGSSTNGPKDTIIASWNKFQSEKLPRGKKKS